jgi:hypothetical protein
MLTGRILETPHSASLFCLSSFWAFNLATVSLLDSWKVGFVGARPFGGGAGVGNDMLIGRRFKAR